MTATDRRVSLPGEGDGTGAASVAADEARVGEVVQLAELVLVVALGGLIGTWFEPVFDDLALLVPSLLASSICAAVGWWTVRRLRWPPTASALASLAGYVVTATVLVSGAPTPSAMADVLAELVDGPSTILTSPLPVSSAGLIAVVPLAVVWLAVWGAVELDLRTDAVFAPHLPLALASLAPAALGGTATLPSVGRLTVVLAVAGLLAVVRTLRPRVDATSSARTASALRRRRLTLGVPLLVLVALVAPRLTAVLGIDADDRYDPRSVPAGDELDLRSPLARVDAVADARKETAAFTAVGSTGMERWRLAVLDRYDGVSWTSSAVFAPAGSVLPVPDPTGGRREVRAAVTVGDLGTRFVPTPGMPIRVRGLEVRHDASTGTLYAPDGFGRGDRYEVTALESDPSPDDLALASADRSGSSALTQVPGGGRAIAALAREEVEARRDTLSGTPDHRTVRAIQATFADKRRFRLAREPVSGESLRQLGTVLGLEKASSDDEDEDEDEPNQGSRQQLTAAMAVMLRTQGLPTRVVVGYRTPSNTDGRYQVTNRQATAWVEVRFEGYGWVPFDAVPTAESDTPPTTTTTTPPTSTPQSSTSSPTPSSTTVPTQAGANDTDGRADGGGEESSVLALVAALVAVLAVLGAALLLLRRPLVRARRRRAADPQRRLRGAWLDVTDRLHRARVPVEPSMTVTEVRDAGRPSVDEDARPHLDDLASLVTVSSWSGRNADDATAETAWHHADALAGKVHKGSRSAAEEAVPADR